MSFYNKKKSHTISYGIFFVITLIIIDQIIKWFVLQSQTIQHFCNYGIAMGIVLPTILFVVLWLVIMSFVIYFWVQKLQDKFMIQLPFILILAGGLSNLIDRIYYGCVVDFIPFLNISNFNIADVFITVGAGLILWQSFMSEK